MTQMRREQSLLFFPIKFVPFLSCRCAVCSEQAEAESAESLENAPKITCLENSTSKQVIVSCLSGLSWELLWHRVHVLSQNPQLDCNQGVSLRAPFSSLSPFLFLLWMLNSLKLKDEDEGALAAP